MIPLLARRLSQVNLYSTSDDSWIPQFMKSFESAIITTVVIIQFSGKSIYFTISRPKRKAYIYLKT